MRMAQIEYFLAVAEKLSFTQAAESLYVSQPALSKQITLMEEELGIRLFNRSTRSVTLTDAGQILYTELEDVMDQLKKAVNKAIMAGNSERKKIRIGCFDGMVTEDFLPGVYQHIENTIPELEISLFRGNFLELETGLENNDFDLIITLDIAFSEAENLKSITLARREGAVIYSDKSPLAKIKNPTLEDFSKYDMYTVDKKTAPLLYASTVDHIGVVGIKPAFIRSCQNMFTMMTEIEMGHGFTLLSKNVVENRPNIIAWGENVVPAISVKAVWKKNNLIAEYLMDKYQDIVAE